VQYGSLKGVKTFQQVLTNQQRTNQLITVVCGVSPHQSFIGKTNGKTSYFRVGHVTWNEPIKLLSA